MLLSQRVCLLGQALLSRSRPLTLRHHMELAEVVSVLGRLAPLALAESWDNVGLLVEPSPPHQVRTLLLTNDLTEDVMEEALRVQAQLILSYHPPLFRPVTRVTMATWKERLVVRALENRVAIYSPHTAFDASPHGVNDWLAKGLGDCSTVPLTISVGDAFPSPGSHRLEVTLPEGFDVSLLTELESLQGVRVTEQPLSSGSRLSLTCPRKALAEAVRLVSAVNDLRAGPEIVELQKPPIPHTGMGRLCILREKVSVATLIERVKDHLKLAHVRLALGTRKTLDSPVASVALCAGSGASILRGVEADVFLTGEMSHHEVLDAVAAGTSVVLCEHSNTERGFLTELRDVLTQHLQSQVTVLVSAVDKDPLQVV
ncbi:NIF3-like protein 1 isoform X1 [Scyliorhinus torazame]|uniref:NIF3-like protein 1 isoform X1 n=2 Tax=Scyliorhinus torazame TaxID=75743 RepID=UPI003B5B8A6A